MIIMFVGVLQVYFPIIFSFLIGNLFKLDMILADLLIKKLVDLGLWFYYLHVDEKYEKESKQ